MTDIALTVNGTRYTRTIEPRRLLADFLREDLGLTGTHLGCEHGVCGACTLLLEGRAVRSCLLFAIQADGMTIETVEGLAGDDELSLVQEAFWDNHALQCGFCTPGILMTTMELLANHPDPSDDQIIEALSGHICRCTGYVSIVRAVRDAAAALNETAAR